jgi:anhydro-N-acetylmuramic acid kinase
VPAFHQGVFGQAGRTTLVLNIGGIANLSVLGADGAVQGFDCGPGNALMDGWCQRHTGQPYDDGGRWAASGQVQQPLLQRLLAEPFFAQQPPKSTGRDLFHADWLATQLATTPEAAAATAADIQATLTELTAASCADAVRRWGRDGSTLLVCGGGALNTHLMQRIAALLPGVQVGSTAERGLPPLEVEAAAFAWLARQCLRGLPGNLPAVTGACGPRVLGAIYPA